MKILSIDAETNGLWGKPFAIAAILYENGVEQEHFIARLSDDNVSDVWVIENVLPTLTNIPISHETYEEMLSAFANFYLKHREDAKVIVHIGFPVESNLFLELHRLGFIGDWEAPFPIYDLSSHLDLIGENPLSVDEYVKKMNIQVTDYGTTHNPLYDCEVAAKTYMKIFNYESKI